MRTDRTARFTFWLSPQERDRLHAHANKHNVTAADLIRASVLGGGAVRALPSRDLLTQAIRQASGAAGNINQLARRINEAAQSDALDANVTSNAIAELRDMHRPIVVALDTVQAEIVRLRRAS